MAGRTFQIEHAKSNRSKCKKCKGKIDKFELRIGIIVDRDDDYPMTSWHCVGCFAKIKFRKNPPESDSDLQGFKHLTAAEKKRVRKILWPDANESDDDSESESKSDSGGDESSDSESASKRKVRSKRPKKRKRSESDDDDSDVAASPPKAKRFKPIPKKKLEGMKVVELRNELGKRGLSKGGKKDELIDRLIDAQKAPSASAAKAKPKENTADKEFKKRYNADKKKADEMKEELQDETVATLKDMLRHNNQKLGGNKSELIARIIDGKLYGTLPRCPDCGSGMLIVRYKDGKAYGHNGEGSWSCPGYFDDEDFIRCKYRSVGAVDRPKWKELDE